MRNGFLWWLSSPASRFLEPVQLFLLCAGFVPVLPPPPLPGGGKMWVNGQPWAWNWEQAMSWAPLRGSPIAGHLSRLVEGVAQRVVLSV